MICLLNELERKWNEAVVVWSEILPWHFPRANGETMGKKSQPGQSLSRLRFDSDNSWIQVWSVIAWVTLLDLLRYGTGVTEDHNKYDSFPCVPHVPPVSSFLIHSHWNSFLVHRYEVKYCIQHFVLKCPQTLHVRILPALHGVWTRSELYFRPGSSPIHSTKGMYELFYDDVSIQIIQRRMVWWLVSNELERIWKEAVTSLLKELSRHSPRGIEKINEKPVRIAGVPTDIRTEHLPNTSLERYRYIDLLGGKRCA
jgi:hypothetical protein